MGMDVFGRKPSAKAVSDPEAYEFAADVVKLRRRL
jgi:hypothetical protein